MHPPDPPIEGGAIKTRQMSGVFNLLHYGIFIFCMTYERNKSFYRCQPEKAVAKGERLAEKRARRTDSDKITNPKKNADLRRPAL